jgi:predicted neutral ceramidase superfamily lipid hydrolase
MVPILDQYTTILAYVSADMIVGLFLNTLLVREEHGTKLGWTLSPFKPYLTKEKAILVALVQTALAILIPTLFLTDLLQGLIASFSFMVWPISMIVWNTVYLTTVRAPLTEQYDFRLEEFLIAFAIYASAIVWIITTFS